MEIKKYNETVFEDIKHSDEYGNEYWLARELMKALEYSKWSNFVSVIKKAKSACELSGKIVYEHFTDAVKLSKRNNNAIVKIEDFKLSRYACYLIVQNADPRKEVVALGQTYFAVQTRRQELTEIEYSMLTEDEKRFYQRNLTKKGNYSLNQAAKKAGVKNNIGKNIREVIAKNGGTMPEYLPTPKKSLKELEKERKYQDKLINLY